MKLNNQQFCNADELQKKPLLIVSDYDNRRGAKKTYSGFDYGL